MKASTEGVRLKLARADERLALLHGKRTLLLKPERYRVVGCFDPDSRQYVFRMLGPQPTLEWGLLIGEFAHLLRSALDNILWQLILARGGTPDKTREFPIYEHETDRKGKSNLAKARMQTAGVLKEDFAFIEGCQPYHERRHPSLLERKGKLPQPKFDARADRYAAWHPLALLGHLNNVDKHQYIHAVVAAAAMEAPGRTRNTVVSILGGTGSWDLYWLSGDDFKLKGMVWPKDAGDTITEQGSWHIGGTFDDSAEVARVSDVVARGDAWPEMKVEPSPIFDVAIGDWKRPMTVFDLDAIRDMVHEIVERFAPLID